MAVNITYGVGMILFTPFLSDATNKEKRSNKSIEERAEASVVACSSSSLSLLLSIPWPSFRLRPLRGHGLLALRPEVLAGLREELRQSAAAHGE